MFTKTPQQVISGIIGKFDKLRSDLMAAVETLEDEIDANNEEAERMEEVAKNVREEVTQENALLTVEIEKAENLTLGISKLLDGGN